MGFEGLTTLGGPLLLDNGASEDWVGFLFFLPNVAAMALGALLGGFASDRFGRRLCTLIGEACAALCVLWVGYTLWRAAPEPIGVQTLTAAVITLYFFIGLATASLYGLLMELTDARVAAFQFCVFMSGINLATVGASHFLGRVLEPWGYGPSFMTLAAISLGALVLLPLLKRSP